MTSTTTTTAQPIACPHWCIEGHDDDPPGEHCHRGAAHQVPVPANETELTLRLHSFTCDDGEAEGPALQVDAVQRLAAQVGRQANRDHWLEADRDQRLAGTRFLVSVAEAARFLGVKPLAVSRLCHRGDLPSGQIGELTVIPVAAVHERADAIAGSAR